ATRFPPIVDDETQTCASGARRLQGQVVSITSRWSASWKLKRTRFAPAPVTLSVGGGGKVTRPRSTYVPSTLTRTVAPGSAVIATLEASERSEPERSKTKSRAAGAAIVIVVLTVDAWTTAGVPFAGRSRKKSDARRTSSR